MKSYSLFFRFTNYNPKVTYHVELFRQPLPRYLIAKVYDWYSLRTFKIPGFRWFDSWHHRRFGKGDWTFIPISARQDIRAHFLREKGKDRIITLEIDRDTYIRLGGTENTPAKNASFSPFARDEALTRIVAEDEELLRRLASNDGPVEASP